MVWVCRDLLSEDSIDWLLADATKVSLMQLLFGTSLNPRLVLISLVVSSAVVAGSPLGGGVAANGQQAQATDPAESAGMVQARDAYTAGRYQEAIELLEPLRASLTDSARLWEVHLYIGMSRLGLGNESGARSAFASAVRAEVNLIPNEDAYPAQAVDLYKDSRDDLVGAIKLDSQPSGARAFIAGRAVGTTPYEGPVLAGNVEIRLELEDFFNETRRGSVLAGRTAEFMIPLRLTPAAIQRLRNEQRDIRELTGEGSGKRSKYILIGAGAAAAVATIATVGKTDEEAGVQVDRVFTGTLNPFNQAGPFIANTRRSGTFSATATWDNPDAIIELEIRRVREFFETLVVTGPITPTSSAVSTPVEAEAIYHLIVRNLTPLTTQFTVNMDFPR